MNNNQFDRLIDSLLNTKERSDFAALSLRVIGFLQNGLERAYERGDREGLKDLLELFTGEPRLFAPSGRVDYLTIPTSPQSCRNLLERGASILLDEMAKRFFDPFAALNAGDEVITTYGELQKQLTRFLHVDCTALLSAMPLVEGETMPGHLLSQLEKRESAGRVDNLAELLKEGVKGGLYESPELRRPLFAALTDCLAMEQRHSSTLSRAASMAVRNRTVLAAALLAGLPPYLYPLLKESWPFNRLEEEEMRAHRFKPLIEQLGKLAGKSRSEGLLALEDDLDDLDEPLLRKGVEWMVDGVDPATLREMLESSLASALDEQRRRGQLITGGLLVLQAGHHPRVVETVLTEQLSSREREYYGELKARFELGDPVDHFPNKGLEHLILYIISLCEMARREGLLSLEAEAEEATDPLIKLGLFIVLEGTEPDLAAELIGLNIDSLAVERELFGRIIVEGVLLLQAGCPPGVLVSTLQLLIPFYSELALGECPAALATGEKIKRMELVRKQALGCPEGMEDVEGMQALSRLEGGERLEAAAQLYLERPLRFYKSLNMLDYLMTRLECNRLIAARGCSGNPARIAPYSLESLHKLYTEERTLLLQEIQGRAAEPASTCSQVVLEAELQHSINGLVERLEGLYIESAPEPEPSPTEPGNRQLESFIKELSHHFRKRNEEMEELNRKSRAELSLLTERYIGELHSIGAGSGDEPEAAIVRELLKQGVTDLRQVHSALTGEKAAAFMRRIFNFNDLALLSDREIQLVLREIDINRLAQALKGAPDELLARVMSNMGSRGAELLKEEIEFTAPMTEDEVREARDYVGMVIVKVVLG